MKIINFEIPRPPTFPNSPVVKNPKIHAQKKFIRVESRYLNFKKFGKVEHRIPHSLWCTFIIFQKFFKILNFHYECSILQ